MRTAWLLLWAVLLMPLPAFGQDEDTAGDDDDSADDDDHDHDDSTGDDHDHDDHTVHDSVTVTAASPAKTDTHARVEIEETALERTRGQDLAQAVSQVPGVTTARGTADSSKPVIRGHAERRLLVLYDGTRHASQKWGSDHATEIDPFAAGSLSVIKGAAGVRYGPDAIGGVVLVEPHPLLATPGIDGEVQLVASGNGPRVAGAARLDLAPAKLPGFVARIEGNYARGGPLRTPTYVLGNTGSQVWNAGATLHVHRGPLHLTAAYSHYDLRAGVFYGVASSSPDAFLAGLERDEPLGADTWTASPAIDRPYQAVAHDRAQLKAVVHLARAGTLHAAYAFQHNHRREFEPARASITGPQYAFKLRTHSLDVAFDHASLPLGAFTSTGGLGIAAELQDNVYEGLPLIPNHRAATFGVFGFERLVGTRFALEIGGRYDHHGRRSFLTDSAFARHVGRGTLSDEDCVATESARRCGLAFDTGSVSAGVLVKLPGDAFDLKVDLSSASRFPNGDELYMNGSAPTFPVYALGDPSLKPETTWSASPTLGLTLPWLTGEVSGFVSFIDEYIQFAPELAADGAPRFDVTVRGAFPRFRYSAVDAVFFGVDGGLTLGPAWPVSLRLEGALVRATSVDTGRPLLFIPADRVAASVRVTPPHAGPLHDGFVELRGEYVFEQRHTDEAADLAAPPPGVFLLSAGAGARFHLHNENTLEVGVEASNLLNRRYRDYTSLLRYVADEPGVDVRLRLRFSFHQHPVQRTLHDAPDAHDPDHHDPDDHPPHELRGH